MNQAGYGRVLWSGEVELRRGFRLPAKIFQDARECPFLVIFEPGARLRTIRTRMPREWFFPAVPEGVYRRLAWSQ
jgi:hypothetical protein